MYEYLSQWKWYAVKHRNTYYAHRGYHVNGKLKTVKMHRLLLNAKFNEITDHANNNGLDNRINNLRICTKSQNQFNRIKQKKNCSSKYKGVYYEKIIKNKHWRASITKNGNTKWLGNYELEIDAAKAYDKQAIKLFGEYANCNFI
jgi:hypothetical protein